MSDIDKKILSIIITVRNTLMPEPLPQWIGDRWEEDTILNLKEISPEAGEIYQSLTRSPS